MPMERTKAYAAHGPCTMLSAHGRDQRAFLPLWNPDQPCRLDELFRSGILARSTASPRSPSSSPMRVTIA